MKSIKSKNQSKEQKVIHPIPPYNGYGSEEDSLLNVFYLDISNKNKERYIDRFKKDKHILRFSAKMISSNPSNEERAFLISFFCGDETIQIFEIAGKNSGRESGKFLERQRIKNPYTHKYYTEKDFSIGNLIYVNTYIFKLIQSDEYTRKYMRDNPEVFRDSDMNAIYERIHAVADKQIGDYDEFLVRMLAIIDPNGSNWANSDAIESGFKTLGITLSPQQASTICGFLKREGMNYSMEDLFYLMK